MLLVARPEEFRPDEIAAELIDGSLSYVIVADFLQQVQFYPDPERFRGVFQRPESAAAGLPTFAPDELVINVRAGEVLDGLFQYPLVPAGFYRSLVQVTGLRPVLMGQLDQSLYFDSLRAALPDARCIPSQGAIRDFQMLRSAHHIVPSVSTFSWLGAWLSHAMTVHLPVVGFYHPTLIHEIDLLPLHDPRYRFYLLPHSYGVEDREAVSYHRTLDDNWPLVPGAQLAFIRERAPFVRTGSEVEPTVDYRWYAHTYRDAAWEIAEGWYANPQHHYQAIGKRRGYLREAPLCAPPADDLPNLALGCRAQQSSVCAASAGRSPVQDAGRAVSGMLHQPYAFHTDLEAQPWWQVDLGRTCRISHVVIHNRCDNEQALWQASPLLILLSDDGASWRLAYRSRVTQPVGDADGAPMTWHADPGTSAQFLRIQLVYRRSLHLRQVAVYGLPAGQSVPAADQ